ncbi:GNAT family N-acetyltransferase [Breznakia pachnodae]|uniref:Acetyltransferase n=1 Tax=Breznakia pachnodae TaxID=265178 RepID=A0ABU0E6Z2_9FIRM|nr:GNAT family N-acetyltransferase [Breznakia pachnodae]MDQ0362591.1 putative acetyltransferase [Breznakia pachnodae]
MKLELVRPTLELKKKALAYRQEHFDYDERVINGSELFDQIDSYDEWLDKVNKNSNAETVDPNWVVTDTFFAVDREHDCIVGMIDLRHTLNDFLKNFGHSGYSVRPSERNKGYASEMLRQLLDVARAANMPELLLSVAKSNEASIKTIIKNGGVYHRSFEYDGELADIYRIEL